MLLPINTLIAVHNYKTSDFVILLSFFLRANRVNHRPKWQKITGQDCKASHIKHKYNRKALHERHKEEI